MGCSRRVQRGGEARHEGVMFLIEMPCGVAEERDHAAARRQLQWARGVCSGAVGRGRGDQPGKGSIAGSMARHRGGLCVWGRVGDCVHACVCSWLGALGWYAFEGMGER
jgi:hypothetical protein